MGVIAHTFNHNIQKAGPGTSQIQGQPGLYMSSKTVRTTQRKSALKKNKQKKTLLSNYSWCLTQLKTVSGTIWEVTEKQDSRALTLKFRTLTNILLSEATRGYTMMPALLVKWSLSFGMDSISRFYKGFMGRLTHLCWWLLSLEESWKEKLMMDSKRFPFNSLVIWSLTPTSLLGLCALELEFHYLRCYHAPISTMEARSQALPFE